MNKRLRNFIDPNTGVYLAVLCIFTAATMILGFFVMGQDTREGRVMMMLAAVETVVIIILAIYFFITIRKKQKQLESYIESVAYDSENAKNSTLANLPLPITVFSIDDTRIIWGNEIFFKLCGTQSNRLDAKISDMVDGFSAKWLREGKSDYPGLVVMNGRKYRVHGNLIRQNDTKGDIPFMGITYWMDVTEYDDTRIEYEQSRPVAAIIIIDNYEELIKNRTDRERNNIRDSVEDRLSEWAAQNNGILRRYDRDRYIAILEKRNLEKLKAEKFPIIESIHEVVSPTGIAVSLSFGLGEDAGTMAEALQYADLASELALSRGGDQAVVRNRLNYEFFGGRGNEIEKRTKVKSRVMASTLKELILDSSKVFVMGHRYSDLDSVGAATGICVLARQCGVKVNIVIDENNTASSTLINMLRSENEYKNIFITPQDAVLHADGRTLLVIVDTNRPEQVEEPDLLDACHRVAVIDHHRVAATYIHNAAIGFIEPYASSASELVAEVLQETADVNDIKKYEANALLAGMVLDTKNFTLRTGERTFDAAAYLKRLGADTIEVKKLFQSGMEDTINKYRILETTELYRNIAIATPKDPQSRVVAAKAADEMLNISGVEASIVLSPMENGGVFASARSIGELNVQIIMEKMGGGGNRNAAAMQMKDADVDQALEQLHQAIDEYFA